MPNETANHPRQILQYETRGSHVLRVADFVGDEVFVKSKSVVRDDGGENLGRLFGRARFNVFAAFEQLPVGEVLVHSAAGPQVIDRVETQAGGFDCGRGRRDPSRTTLEETFGIGVRESDRSDSSALKLQENRMLANDFKQRCVRKALLVMANRCRRVDPSE